MKEFIQRLAAKPEHVRKRIALGASAGFTALVLVAWSATMVSTGAFATGPGAAAPQPAPVALTSTNIKSNFNQLMGAVGAATASTSKPALTVIDGKTTSSLDATTTNPSATVIPF